MKLNVNDFREAARHRLPKGLFEFVDRGTEDEVALSANRDAFLPIRFMPRTLRDVSARSLQTTLFGQAAEMPLAISPTGAAGLLWHNGEVHLARAAAAAGIPFTVATGSLTALERIATEAPGRLWFQLYIWPEKELSYQLVQRAFDAGYEALVVTVDTGVTSNREYNLRNGFTIPFRLTAGNMIDVLSHPRWMASVLGRYLATSGLPKYENYPSRIKQTFTAAPMGKAMPKSDSVTWVDLAELRSRWPRKLIVKGILSPGDARKAVDSGADAVIVSNHGGRMLDSVIPTIDALPDIVGEVAGAVPVFVDSGFRRGSDIVKALCLGAAGVMVGRAPLYGLATGGEAGAAQVLDILKTETLRVMGLLGAPQVSDLSPEFLVWHKDVSRPVRGRVLQEA
ncbi:alpha-hydroxy acid oxidase [Pseudorhizobium pelagicum]|uniref:alpha-hydroxy acid oxidase n=1 Tax=Pseudorhizobium pelagicum TaxID=1509405 RepID=UPI0004DA7ADB|nr:alpha-hydroxy acid oxidase [Pseudorhizobium pelagicum]KEQ03693.1 hypothetical protein GV67_12565 [Pseudorhizobium pelagicum]